LLPLMVWLVFIFLLLYTLKNSSENNEINTKHKSEIQENSSILTTFLPLALIIITVVAGGLYYINDTKKQNPTENKNNFQTTINNDDKTDTNFFSKKMECQKLQTELEKKLKETHEEISFDKIFYSPVIDTCLYTYRVWYKDDLGKPSFYLADALTNANLYSMISLKDNDPATFSKLFNRFNEVVSDYENANTDINNLPESGSIANFENIKFINK
jgi:Ca2+/Na+ antiporter